ncbi:MAG: LysR family transcriptional regulator [Pseudomonadota bacterium]|nr:LysR family transcriptional regulator [Pseudomonadota bacterium]
MSITFRQLEIFVAAAGDCNFRRTAERLGVSQPSISNQIRALEGHLGHNLFERRRGSPPELSDEGRVFLEKAKELVVGRQEMEQQTRHTRGPRAIRLAVTATPLLLDAYIRPRLPTFCEQNPNIQLDFVPLHPTRGAAPMVLSGEVDLAVFTGDFQVDDRLQSEVVNTVGVSIYCSPQLARRAARGVRLSDLPWIMPPDEFKPTRFMWRILKEAGIEPTNIIARSQFPDVIANMCLEGHGFAVLFDHHAANGLTDGRIVKLGPPLPSTSLILLVGPRAQRPAAQPAVDMFRQATRRLANR